MKQDDPMTSAPLAVRSPDEDTPKVATIDTTGSPALSAEALAVFENLAPLMVEPETLIQAPLSAAADPRVRPVVALQGAAMVRAAHLDPDILDIAPISAGPDG